MLLKQASGFGVQNSQKSIAADRIDIVARGGYSGQHGSITDLLTPDFFAVLQVECDDAPITNWAKHFSFDNRKISEDCVGKIGRPADPARGSVKSEDCTCRMRIGIDVVAATS